ncbi:MAG: DUF4367 domain-containing protein [Oscillospiraceae bacterium]|nr:DUF4367 domain-containing protein [Oscillospiraceae bacterium]
MNEQKKQKLLEQYDDAAFALLMDEYAEEEGARLMAEFEAAQAAGQVPEMPQTLDEQCRRMIRRDRAKKRSKQAVRSFRKVAVKAAVAVLVFIGLMTTVVMSVEALRVPMLNYLVKHSEKYSSIDFTDQSDKETLGNSINPLANLIPEGYSEVTYEDNDGLISAIYENEFGNYILLSMVPTSGELWFDTEGATCENVTLGDYSAILIREERLQMIWVDEDMQICFSFVSDGLDEDTFRDICESLASFWKNQG